MPEASTTKAKAKIFWAIETNDKTQPDKLTTKWYTENDADRDVVEGRYLSLDFADIDEELVSGSKLSARQVNIEKILSRLKFGRDDRVQWEFLPLSPADLWSFDVLKLRISKLDKTRQMRIMKDVESILTYNTASNVKSKQVYSLQFHMHKVSEPIRDDLQYGIHYRQTPPASLTNPVSSKVQSDAKQYQERFKDVAMCCIRQMESVIAQGDVVFHADEIMTELKSSISKANDVQATENAMRDFPISAESFALVQSMLSERSEGYAGWSINDWILTRSL